MILADSHVHLHAYADDEIDGMLARARRAGVEIVVGIGVDLETSRRTIEIARHRPGVVAAVGIHPAHFSQESGVGRQESDAGGQKTDVAAALSGLEVLARDPAAGFIGEIGLALVEGTAGIEQQRAVFEDQLALARTLDLPVNLHIQGAFDDAFAALRRAGVPAAGAVLHYFDGDESLARQALDLGLHLSVGKPVTHAGHERLGRAVRLIPLDRLILETDTYPLPGRRTEPADVRLVAEAVAALVSRRVEEVAEATTANLVRLLGAAGKRLAEGTK
ncbi:MAG TPA: TatD family hydrolase [Chloroflexota bacterium]|nr:TatD family hydrolase [Chloroflexota bacterium]